jgi:hypothetical protein
MVNSASTEVIKMLMDIWPEAAEIRDEHDQTPLHLGVANSASPDSIKMVIEAYPDAVKAKDKSEKTPLYLGLANNVSAEVVKVLVDIWPGAVIEEDKFKRTPLHFALLSIALRRFLTNGLKQPRMKTAMIEPRFTGKLQIAHRPRSSRCYLMSYQV